MTMKRHEVEVEILKRFDDAGHAHRDDVFETIALECRASDPKLDTRVILDAWNALHLRGAIAPGQSIDPRTENDDRRRYVDLGANLYNGNLREFGRVFRHDFPWARLTDHGREIVAEADRDPANRDGYLTLVGKHLSKKTVAWFYIGEGLTTYEHGCYTATAVLVGAAYESLVLSLRDVVADRVEAKGGDAKDLRAPWQAKRIVDALSKRLDAALDAMPGPLRELYQTRWRSSVHFARMTRNEAGHPRAVDPIKRTDAREMLVGFPNFAELVSLFTRWVPKHL